MKGSYKSGNLGLRVAFGAKNFGRKALQMYIVKFSKVRFDGHLEKRPLRGTFKLVIEKKEKRVFR